MRRPESLAEERSRMKEKALARRIKTGIQGTEITEDDVRQDVERAKKYPFAAYAVDTPYLVLAKELLDGTGILLTAPVSYSLGGMTLETRLEQIAFAIRVRADEINPSLNFNAVKSGDFATVLEEIKRMVEAAGDTLDVIVIPQLYILTNEEKLRLCQVILEGGVSAIKTNGHGSLCRPEDVLLIRREFGDAFSIEASGGIRTTQQALELLDAGADIIHTSTAYSVLADAERP
jgi:deoxyribose-phosphate aldolase